MDVSGLSLVTVVLFLPMVGLTILMFMNEEKQRQAIKWTAFGFTVATFLAALLMWFWLSAYAICMGAELNSQLELFTTQDTTVDGPAKPGQRGAFVADHIENPEQASGPTPQAEDVTIPQDLERMPHSRLP